jgi:SAM-dependent methyltransferase
VQPHEGNLVQAAFWEVAGPLWAQKQDLFDAQVNLHGLRAIDVLAPAAGESIMDIGCGTGTSSFQLAERVGSDGRVVGYDISSTMVSAARSRAAGMGATNVEFDVADAHTHSFEPTADAVYSRFGVMFFADPHGAFANIRTGLRPGGRLAFVCWQSPALNPWISKPMEAVRKYVELPFGADPNAPSPFAFADPDRIRDVLAGGGFTAVAIEPCEKPVNLGPDVDAALTFITSRNPATATLPERDPDLWEKVRADVYAVLSPYLTDHGVETESATWLVTASNPA